MCFLFYFARDRFSSPTTVAPCSSCCRESISVTDKLISKIMKNDVRNYIPLVIGIFKVRNFVIAILFFYVRCSIEIRQFTL
jgi:hypothetical protein